MTRRAFSIAAAATLVVVVAAIAVVWTATASVRQDASAQHPSPSAAPPSAEPAAAEPAAAYVPPSEEKLGALPEAMATMAYRIGGLLPFDDGPVADDVYRLTADAPVYGADRDADPVARLDAENFLHEPTVVVVSRFEGDWALVLTPARIALPSASDSGTAPAQSAGWVRRDLLTVSHEQTSTVEVDVAAGTATILTTAGDEVATFPVGVGGPETPSPSGVTYLQARYLDPSQGQTEHRIQLTGAYSAQSDAPWQGSAHIGLHFSDEPDADSHGCIRMTAEGIEAIDALPLGTIVRFVGGE